MLKRIVYLGYYLKKLDLRRFRRFYTFVRANHEISRLQLLADIVVSSLRYNISLLEYFQFRFVSLSHDERKSYAGTGYMYEYQLEMNPKSRRAVLEDKAEFIGRFRDLVSRKTATVEELRQNSGLREELLATDPGKIVLKHTLGQCGWQVRVCDSADFLKTDLVTYMENHGYDLAEEFVVQHPDMERLSPSAVNTVRIVTQMRGNGEVEILAARLRISQDSTVDNLAAGNMAAAVDIGTGVVTGPAVYGDIDRREVTVHPVSGVSIVGFEIPFWRDVLELAESAASRIPEMRSVGWDIAVTTTGPELIEGNHDWCKLVWQLPVKTGLKAILDVHLSELREAAS